MGNSSFSDVFYFIFSLLLVPHIYFIPTWLVITANWDPPLLFGSYGVAVLFIHTLGMYLYMWSSTRKRLACEDMKNRSQLDSPLGRTRVVFVGDWRDSSLFRPHMLNSHQTIRMLVSVRYSSNLVPSLSRLQIPSMDILMQSYVSYAVVRSAGIVQQ